MGDDPIPKRKRNSSIPLKLLIDMDGVLCDFEASLLDRFRSRHPDEPFIPLDERNTFYAIEQYASIKPNLKSKVGDIISSPGFFRSLPPLTNAVRCLHWMDDFPDVSVWLCTAPINRFHNCVLEKYEWVEKHLGFEWTKKVIMCKDKTLIKGDYLIDDRPAIRGEEQFNPNFGQHVVFTQPYNRTVETKWRLDCWPKTRDALLEFIQWLQKGVPN